MKKWICTVCKHVFEGDAPPVPCPVCAAGREAFELQEGTTGPFRRDTEDEFVIIGGGTAGLEAAKAIRARNATAGITLVGGERHLPYRRPALPAVIADGKPFDELLIEKADFYPSQRIELVLGAPATGIDPGEKRVQLADGRSLPYTGLLLATGAKPFNPIKSAHGSVPVKVLRCYEDALDLAAFATGHRILLVGGGILGLEAAVALQKHGAEVTVVEYAPRILPIQADEAVSEMLADALDASGIRLICGNSVTEAVQRGALLADGTTLETDLILASMGVRSEMDLAVAIGLDLSRGIVVDDHMRTSRSDIWAAGDCAEYGGRVLALAGAAASMGAVAGASMAGDDSLAYRPFVPATMFQLPGFSLFSAGNVGSAPPETETVIRRVPAENRYGRLFLTEGRLSGALFVNGAPAGAAVKALADAVPLAEALPLLG